MRSVRYRLLPHIFALLPDHCQTNAVCIAVGLRQPGAFAPGDHDLPLVDFVNLARAYYVINAAFQCLTQIHGR